MDLRGQRVYSKLILLLFLRISPIYFNFENASIADQANGIVVMRKWPAQSWFLIFESLLTKDTIIFGASDKLLLSFCRSLHHPLSRKLTLITSRLSGKLLE